MNLAVNPRVLALLARKWDGASADAPPSWADYRALAQRVSALADGREAAGEEPCAELMRAMQHYVDNFGRVRSEGFLDFLRLNVLDLLKISTFSVSGFLSPKASSSPYLPQRKYSSSYTRKSKKHQYEKIQKHGAAVEGGRDGGWPARGE